jgi:hypothetical protein
MYSVYLPPIEGSEVETCDATSKGLECSTPAKNGLEMIKDPRNGVYLARPRPQMNPNQAFVHDGLASALVLKTSLKMRPPRVATLKASRPDEIHPYEKKSNW